MGISLEKGFFLILLIILLRINFEENKINFNWIFIIDVCGILINFLRLCVDDEDDCNFEDFGLGDGYLLGEIFELLGDIEILFVNYKENNIKEMKYIINKSVKKFWKFLLIKLEMEVENEVEFVGEFEIFWENCIEDDEDGCNDDNDFG